MKNSCEIVYKITINKIMQEKNEFIFILANN